MKKLKKGYNQPIFSINTFVCEDIMIASPNNGIGDYNINWLIGSGEDWS